MFRKPGPFSPQLHRFAGDGAVSNLGDTGAAPPHGLTQPSLGMILMGGPGIDKYQSSVLAMAFLVDNIVEDKVTPCLAGGFSRNETEASYNEPVTSLSSEL
uniref:Uncharacterized protein n=1 Tax=Coccidioides posadasii RMSCC 3488 TaxID=454284 RepID=A0A0J6I0A1_COCPO|nr:hypothetical protein CPAG_01014 [Coccidioides posadasii RMSCC 3488]